MPYTSQTFEFHFLICNFKAHIFFALLTPHIISHIVLFMMALSRVTSSTLKHQKVTNAFIFSKAKLLFDQNLPYDPIKK